MTAVLWFRRDLRLDDLPALSAAAEAGRGRVAPLFVVDPRLVGAAGPNRRRFLVDALAALERELGGALALRGGDPVRVVPAFAAELDARVVAATADHGPYGASRDLAVADALAAAGRQLHAIDSPYTVPPGTVRGSSGSPLRVYTAYRRALERLGWEPPYERPQVSFVAAASDASAAAIESAPASGLPDWWQGLPLAGAPELPAAGAGAAGERLERFLDQRLGGYARRREVPAVAGTSELSPHLHLGCIHPRTILARLGDGRDAARMRGELIWRDFYADVLWARPQSARVPLREFGERLRWDRGARARARFAAWARGRTGYPLVDAGMRQLLAQGWMHNRVRMLVASFLVKDLHIDWRLGARWFMWHLVDGDLASNQHNWQWVAGTGTDAAPFHRIMNPTLQRERFDADGAYVRRYVPEWRDGVAYAEPIVDHGEERREALARFAAARERS